MVLSEDDKTFISSLEKKIKGKKATYTLLLVLMFLSTLEEWINLFLAIQIKENIISAISALCRGSLIWVVMILFFAHFINHSESFYNIFIKLTLRIKELENKKSV